MKDTDRTTPIGETVSAFCESSACDCLWEHKYKEVLQELLYDDLLDKAAGNLTKNLLVQSRNSGTLKEGLCNPLKKKGSEFARDACERFLIKKYSEFNKEEPPASWIGLVLLRCIGLAVDMPPETFPSE